MSSRRITLLVFFLATLAAEPIISQQQSAIVDPAFFFFQSQPEKWGLNPEDVVDLAFSRRFVSDHNGVSHTYLQQQFNGVPIHNAIAGVHIGKEGQVLYHTSRFLSGLKDRINTATYGVPSGDALMVCLQDLGLDTAINSTTLMLTASNRSRISLDAISSDPIQVDKVYHVSSTGNLILAWAVTLMPHSSESLWRFHIDGNSGAILDKENLTLQCNPGLHRHTHSCSIEFPERQGSLEEINGSSAYRVFPYWLESPNAGNRSLEVDPADRVASPFGWHDIDGRVGAEFNYSRGNNAFAYLDTANRNTPNPSLAVSGGVDRIFDFPFDPSKEPDQQREAALTQAFYMTNIAHDIFYHYGFDEQAGNFQRLNYSGQGRDGDDIRVEVQDGGSRNNANFSTLPDGGPGRMQVYLWDQKPGPILEVIAPQAVSGTYSAGTAGFGPSIQTVDILGALAVGLDAPDYQSSLACGELGNWAEIEGKVALVDRGECKFEAKVKAVEEAGAIACIICNSEDAIINMAGDPALPDPGIPALLLRASDCALLKAELEQGVDVRVALTGNPIDGPELRDGAFDNGLLIHEYAHGISVRLTGGADQVECLRNDEQMGEGWSDFLALAITTLPTQTGSEPRAFGSYLVRGEETGTGIRRQPYSTDFSINSLTYEDLIGTTSPHQLGELWAVTLWDLYWAFIEQYGYDQDLFSGMGGNNIALQLIIDGMKLQPCSPGFLDGRDAILVADSINNEGQHSCLIWEVFARRGMGHQADQGSTHNRNDLHANFDLPPSCSRELVLTKEVDQLVKAGASISVNLKLVNYGAQAETAIVLEDEIPIGTTLRSGSLQGLEMEQEGQKIRLNLGALQVGEKREVSYILETSPSESSQLLLAFEADQSKSWDTLSIEGDDRWTLVADPSTGKKGWQINTLTTNTDQVLQLSNPLFLKGAFPILRIEHSFLTEPAYQAGIFEISTDGGVTWVNKSNAIFRGPKPGKLTFGVFDSNNTEGFWGDSEGAVTSYLDLSGLAGQSILIRFRFGSSPNGGGNERHYWRIEKVELIDLLYYNTEACAIPESGAETVCARADFKGTVIEAIELTTSASESRPRIASFKLFPNPAQDRVRLEVLTFASQIADLSLIDVSGNTLRFQQLPLQQGKSNVDLNLSEIPPGWYIIQLATAEGIRQEKLVIAR